MKQFTMAVSSQLLSAFAVMYPLLAAPTLAGSIADIEHVVLFMQGQTHPHHITAITDFPSENRAFDHYFGTMAGVRGFSDPNVQVNSDKKPVWEQAVNSALTNDTSSLLPWYLNYQGGDFLEATQWWVNFSS